MKNTLLIVSVLLFHFFLFGQEVAEQENDFGFKDGVNLFEVVFNEWEGKSFGDLVNVIVKGDSIKVTYAGKGSLTAAIGETLDEGIILKHKSGVWIIGKNPSDKYLDEIGGCTDGPNVIDFENKKYWMC